ncbi:MAG TPA: ABC transporter permease [Gemmatimonadaceae bacterium]|nr:ABC transporter permease [Gemmatimonadaceae bacterium]
MDRFRQDLRHGVRGLLRARAFTLVAVATLALGIGANSAIFSVVNAVLLKPLPYRAPGRLALIWSQWTNFNKTWVSPAEYLDYQKQDRLFRDVAAWGENDDVTLTGNAGPESVPAMVATANLLDVVGMKPAIGRMFSAAEDIPNGPPVVVLGYGLWQRRFGGNPDILGQFIDIDGARQRVVGVLPAEFRFPLEFQSMSTAQIVQPMQLDRSAPVRGSHGIYGIARLEPGVSVASATAALHALAQRWTREGLYPADMKFTAFAVSLDDEVSGGARVALLVLSAAVGLLLLLTCVNVANLILARADGRAREVAVRAALGASRGDLLGLALTEGLLLGVAGGVLGLALAWSGVRLLVAQAPTSVPRLAELSVDGRVLVVTSLLSVSTGVMFGVVPMLRGARLDLAEALREGARGASGGEGRRRGRVLLIVAETALAALLAVGAGLTVHSFRNLQHIDLGFDPSHVLTARLALPAARYDSAGPVVRFYQQLAERVRALPGVQAAGFVRQLPLASTIGDAGVAIEGRPVPPGEHGRSADWQVVSPGYFEAMRMRLVRGRLFTAADGPGSVPVVAVNEALAREYFAGVDPLGKRMRVGGDTTWRTIVAVIGDVHHNSLLTPVKRKWFLPQAQWGMMFGAPRRAMTLVVRAAGDPRALQGPIRRLVHEADPDLPVSHLRTMTDVVGAATREQRFTMALMAGFAALAVLLAAVGTYGVVSYAVGQRTREIGIRLALGAEAGAVRGLVLRQGMAPAVAGIAVGMAAAVLSTRYLRALLYQVAPLDPVTFGVIPILLLSVAAAAMLVPAVRATRIDPVEALRAE